jgi:hypothetical protein
MEEMNKLSDDKLLTSMQDLFDFYCDGVLEDLGKEMVSKFYRNEGGVYLNQSLNNQINARSEYREILQSITDKISEGMSFNNGNVDKLKIDIKAGPSFDISEGFENKGLKTAAQFWAFTGDRTVVGLSMLIHGTQAVDVYVLEQSVNPKTRTFTLRVEVDVYDDFSVDKCDTQKAIKKLKSLQILPYKGFIAWWILQHQRAHKAFITKIALGYDLSGSY